MEETVWWIAAGLLVVAGLSGPVASAQQSVTTTVAGSVQEAPDELPGVYRANLEVTVEASGGQCLCQQTAVELHASDRSDPVDEVAFSPRGFVVDWTRNADEIGGAEEKNVRVAIGVSEVPENASLLRVTVVPEATSSSQLVHDQTNPTQLAFAIPDGNASQADEASADASQDSGGDEGPDEGGDGLDVATDSAEPVSEAGFDGTAIGTGTAAASLALLGLAVRRFGG
jgi:hypothetical protein